MITCAECGEERELYAKGLCKRCYARAQRQKHKDRIAAYNREYRARDPEKWRAYGKQWHAEHPEQRKESSKRYREAHAEQIAARREEKRDEAREYARRYVREHRDYQRERVARWRRENPERAAELNVAQASRRRARERELLDSLTPQDIDELMATGEAMYPGETLHLDHIVPVSKGGGTTRANMHAIPDWMNHTKGTKLPHEFYSQLELAGANQIGG